MSETPPPLPRTPRSRGLIITVIIVAAVATTAGLCWELRTFLRRPAEALFSAGEAARLVADGDRLSDKADHEGAAQKYRSALRLIPKRSSKTRVMIQWKLADALGSLERYDEQVVILRELLPAYTRYYGENHEDTIACARCFGYALVQANQLDEAEGYLRRVLKASEETGHNDPEDLAA